MYFFFRYCYYESTDVKPDIALATLYAAKKYMLPLLENACRDIQVQNLSADNIWVVYTSSMSNPDDKLRDSCRAYFTKSITNVSTALASPDFLDIPYTTLIDLLQINDVDTSREEPCAILISEIELFNACNRWAEAECLRQTLEPSGPNKRSVLGDCLFLLRFPIMSHADLVHIVSPTGILTLDERNNVFEKENALVQPLLMFPSTDHTIRVFVKTVPNAIYTTETVQQYRRIHGSYYSKFNGEVICNSIITEREQYSYSCIKVEPKNKLSLEGLCYNQSYENEDNKDKFETVIFKETSEGTIKNVWCKSVSSMCRKQSKGIRLAYLPFEPNMVLQAGNRYSIKVGFVGKLDSKPTDINTICIPKTTTDINLNILDQSQNGAIGALFFHLA